MSGSARHRARHQNGELYHSGRVSGNSSAAKSTIARFIGSFPQAARFPIPSVGNERSSRYHWIDRLKHPFGAPDADLNSPSI